MFQGPYIDNGHGALYETKHPSPRGCTQSQGLQERQPWGTALALLCSLELLTQLT